MTVQTPYQAPSYAEVHAEWLAKQALYTPRAQYLVAQPRRSMLKGDDVHIFLQPEHYILLWVESGVYRVRNEAGTVDEYSRPQMFLIPCGVLLQLEAIEGTIHFTTFEFLAHANLCMGMCPSMEDKSVRGRRHGGATAARPRRAAAASTTLPITDGIAHWLGSIEKFLLYADVSLHMYDFKLQECFLLLRLDYTPSTVDDFLRFYHCRISGFRRHITANFRPGMDVMDVYKLGEGYKMNELAFKRTFIEEFGMPPREWITIQRARHVYNELINTSDSIREIAERYNFSSLSYFSLFCKTNLGGTPMQIRKHKGNLANEASAE